MDLDDLIQKNREEAVRKGNLDIYSEDMLYEFYMSEIDSEAERLSGLKLSDIRVKKKNHTKQAPEVTFRSLQGGNDKEFVQRLYVKILGREADDAGMERYIGLLESGKASREDVICSIALSKEAIDRDIKVIGANLHRVSADLLLQFHGVAFINNMYLWVLGRKADDDGMNSCLQALENGIYREEILYSILNSSEGKARDVIIPGINKLKTKARIKRVIKKLPGIMPCIRLYRVLSGKEAVILEKMANEQEERFNEAVSKLTEKANEQEERFNEAVSKLTKEANEQEERFNEAISKLTKEANEQEERFNEAVSKLTEKANEQDVLLRKYVSDLGAVARQTMLAKWMIIDHLRGEKEADNDILTCDICGESHQRSEYETMETDCIFNGGHLTRYVCPKCGVVFGPSKFIAQGQEGIDEDYWVHYLGYSEGDSSYKEERAFRLLEPTKDGVYLNYGCGKWSKTLQKLREEGFNVYGYEPYAPETDNPYLITSKIELMKMRFDGIFSNDLLEHLIHPIEDLIFMKSLLADKHSRMSHCTACYAYKYEYTRFHTHFFLGDSVRIMAESAGLHISAMVDDLKENDFYCYVFAPLKVDANICDIMCLLSNVVRQQDGSLLLSSKAQMFGPYMTLPDGKYRFNFDVECNADFSGKITAYKGQTVLLDNMHIVGGTSSFEAVLSSKEKLVRDVEIIIVTPEGVNARINKISVERICE